ncbi:MAG TPA: hypothetical protein PKN02_11585 [Thermotogota bacterium]|nr:hypothetical protein [Thermotogota bacterium]
MSATLKNEDMRRWVEYCVNQGFSLEKTHAFLENLGEYDKGHADETYFRFRGLEKPELPPAPSYTVFRDDHYHEMKVKTRNHARVAGVIFFVVILAATVYLFITRQKSDQESEKKAAYTILENYWDTASMAYSDLEDGMITIYTGFRAFLEDTSRYKDIDVFMASYIFRAQIQWSLVKQRKEDMLDLLKSLSGKVEKTIYEKAADLYAAICEYEIAISPGGKSSNTYMVYVNPAKQRVAQAKASLKAHIAGYFE